jgi:hypothetical protein
VQLSIYNQTVQVYDPTLTTNFGSANVLLVDPFNSLIQVDSLPTGTAVNDVIVHAFAVRHSRAVAPQEIPKSLAPSRRP